MENKNSVFYLKICIFQKFVVFLHRILRNAFCVTMIND